MEIILMKKKSMDHSDAMRKMAQHMSSKTSRKDDYEEEDGEDYVEEEGMCDHESPEEKPDNKKSNHKSLQALAQKLATKKTGYKEDEDDDDAEAVEEDDEEDDTEKLAVAALNPMIKLLLSILKNGPGK